MRAAVIAILLRKSPTYKNKIGTSTPRPFQKKNQHPTKTRNFMGMLVLQQKKPQMPGAHKIGAAISRPRIAGRKISDMRLVFWESRFSVDLFAEKGTVFRRRRVPSGAPGVHALLNYFGFNFRFYYTYTCTFHCFGT